MRDSDDQRIYEVIISGAGPVGLFLACELALVGCSVLVLEKDRDANSNLKKLPFGIRGLSSTSIEALDRRGLLPKLQIHQRIKDPHKIPPSFGGAPVRRQVGHFAGIPFHEDKVDDSKWTSRLTSATATSLISEIFELEMIFAARAQALGVQIQRGSAVTDLQQTADLVKVQCGDRSLQARWLVGCDGGRSVVRKKVGFDFAGTEPEFTGYTCLVDLADPEKLLPGRIVTSRGMYMQSQPGYIIIQDFDGGAFHGSDSPLTREHLQAVLRRISDTDVTIHQVKAATSWTDRARQVTAYRKGRVLLAGDAAHIHSPLGGQGLNLGLGDAMNLGWKLASTIQGHAGLELLDTYHTERHPVGAQVLNWSRAQVAVMQTTPQAQALHAIFQDLMNTKDAATYFAGRVWGINTKYDLGGDHPLVGKSAPNFEFASGKCLGDLMHDGCGLLLSFAENSEIEKQLSETIPRLKLVTGPAQNQLGLTTTLIRPDGILAWASEGNPNLESLSQAIHRWFS